MVVVTEPSALATLLWLTIVVDEAPLDDEEAEEPPLPDPVLAEVDDLPLEPAAPD